MDERTTYEVYLEVALRFAKKGDFKQADRSLGILRKILRRLRKKDKSETSTKQPRSLQTL